MIVPEDQILKAIRFTDGFFVGVHFVIVKAVAWQSRIISAEYACLPIFSTAAAVAFFCLDTKETKNQDKGKASPLQAIHLGALPFVGATALLCLLLSLKTIIKISFKKTHFPATFCH